MLVEVTEGIGGGELGESKDQGEFGDEKRSWTGNRNRRERDEVMDREISLKNRRMRFQLNFSSSCRGISF